MNDNYMWRRCKLQLQTRFSVDYVTARPTTSHIKKAPAKPQPHQCPSYRLRVEWYRHFTTITALIFHICSIHTSTSPP